jgi:hypothetical protein
MLKVLARHKTLAFFAAAGGSFWAYAIYKSSQTQKSHNSLFRGLIYHLNKSPLATEFLGKHIQFNEGDRVGGHVNVIKGVADLQFEVHGDKETGRVTFVGSRRQKLDSWESEKFLVQKSDGSTLDLQ